MTIFRCAFFECPIEKYRFEQELNLLDDIQFNFE